MSISYEIEAVLNAVSSVSKDLDYLLDPELENKMSCSLDYCIGNDTGGLIGALIEDSNALSVIERKGVELL